MKHLAPTRAIAFLAAAALMTLTACGQQAKDEPTPTPAPASPTVAEPSETPAAPAEPVTVAALKGPTGMGLAKLMADQGAASPKAFDVTLYGAPDEISPQLVKGDLDAAAVPVNLAAVLFNKTDGNVKLAAVNTLGVLYVLAKGEDVAGLADLAGKTVYSTGKGTTPEYVLSHLLAKAGLEGQVTVEYLSEASEVAARLASEPKAVAVLPEPYVTTVTAKDPSIQVAVDLSQAWQEAVGSPLVTGALVVNAQWADGHKDQYEAFMAAYKESVEFTNADPAQAAQAIAQAGIVPEAAIAQQAIPRCHIVFLTGAEAEAAVEPYLKVLFEADPAAVGGTLPDAEFFFTP